MHELAIIGAGAAGTACAKSALAAGLKTILFDKNEDSFGGTCLNLGCIPTKYFLQASKCSSDWKSTKDKCLETVSKIKQPFLTSLKKSGLDVKWGNVEFIDANTLKCDNDTYQAKNIVIATGSVPQKIVNHPKAVAAQELFAKESIGKKALIVGAGYIGVEFASLLNGFGCDVTVVEKLPQILPFYDATLSKRLRIILEKKGIKFNTGKSVDDFDLDSFDEIVLATGRVSDLEPLKLVNAGLEVDENGWVKTDEYMRTNVSNIYACGDATGKQMLAYTGEYQAELCVANIKGENKGEDYSVLPQCVFSKPSFAKVGILEDEAKNKGINYKVLKTNFLKSSSSYVYNDTDGFIQILVDSNNKIIGAGIISNLAAELIHIFSLCIQNNIDLDQLKKAHFIHPTLSEIIGIISRESV
jgi:dihydrolipoamide dehydrogenase